MSNMIKNKLKKAEQAIDEIFGDTRVSKSETLDALEELASNLDVKIDLLRSDIDNESTL